jgi:hypothetical protein
MKKNYLPGIEWRVVLFRGVGTFTRENLMSGLKPRFMCYVFIPAINSGVNA